MDIPPNRGVRGQHRRPGELRSSPVWIGGSTLEDAVFVPPPPDEMKRALSDLERFLHERDLPLLIQLAIAHYQFEVIHPFTTSASPACADSVVAFSSRWNRGAEQVADRET